MNRFTLAVIATIIGASGAAAQGLDRSGQNIDILFEEGNVAELRFGYVAPDASGNDLDLFGGAGSGDVLDNFFQGSIGYKQDLSDQVSFALIVDQPYGANVNYQVNDASGVLNGTFAALDSTSLTGLLRYKFNENYSVHGGLRVQQFNAAVTLAGAGFGALNGFSTTLDGDTGVGYQIGAAYERPDIALRLAVTYFSEIDHDVDTNEDIPLALQFGLGLPAAVNGTNTEVTTPEAVNISFQTGIAKDTLAFANFRYADYGVVIVSPQTFNAITTGASLTNIDRVRTLSVGVGRRFTEKFAGSIALNWSDSGPDDLVSPLAPTNGSRGVTIGASYQVTDAVELAGGINYTRLGDATAVVGADETQLVEFEDNDAIGVGLRLSYKF